MTPERFVRLRRWWASARSTVITLTWEARFWALVGIVGIFWKPLSTSIAVIFFMLQELDFHELPDALANVRAALKTGGVVRILVPDIRKAFAAWFCENEEWFPQDDRTGGIDAKFCTYLTWYGTSKSVFTPAYLQAVLAQAGFSEAHECNYGRSKTSFSGMVGLDSRPREAMVFEATR